MWVWSQSMVTWLGGTVRGENKTLQLTDWQPSCNRFERQFAEASNNFMIKKYWRENQHYPFRTNRILLEMLPHRKKIEIPNFRNTLQVDRLSWLARETWDKLEFAKWFNLTDIWNKVWNFLFWIHSNPPWYFLLSKYNTSSLKNAYLVSLDDLKSSLVTCHADVTTQMQSQFYVKIFFGHFNLQN